MHGIGTFFARRRNKTISAQSRQSWLSGAGPPTERRPRSPASHAPQHARVALRSSPANQPMRCAWRLLPSNLHCKHAFESRIALPQRHRSLRPQPSPFALAAASRPATPASGWLDATLLKPVGVAHGGIGLQICIANAQLNRASHCHNAIAHFALRPRPPLPPPPRNMRPAIGRRMMLTLQIGGVAHGGRYDSTGVVILYRLAASVALGSRQIRQSRNCLPEISNLNVPVLHSKSSGQNAKSARRAKLA
jgi:hypothetical protein